MNREAARPCDCGTLEDLVRMPDSPVQLDSRFREYSLVFGHAVRIMRFCFWCGGALPPSQRSEFFLEPSPEDVVAVREAMAGIRSVQDLVGRLGEPDEAFERNEVVPTRGKELIWRRQLKFSRHWASLDLFVDELPTGDVSYFIAGKPRPQQGGPQD